MYYDPIKDRLGAFFGAHPVRQKVFYALLHTLFLRSWYVRRELRALTRSLPVSMPLDVLDAGTGFGQYAYYIAREIPNSRVLAVDIKPDYLEHAGRFISRTPLKGRLEFEEQDLTVLDLDRRFDLIVSVDVMEHIEDDRRVFRNFARVLKTGGHVIINTPSDQGGSDAGADAETGFIDEHVRPGYSMDELHAKLREAGLVPVRARYTYGTYGSAAWRLLIKRPMQLLALTRAAYLLLPFYYAAALPLGMILHAIDVRSENETGTGLIVVARK